MQGVLRQAIGLQGSTLSDGTYRTAEDEPGGFQNWLRVYQRAGERCLQCGKARILRIVQAQRSTFFCPACQPPRRVRKAAKASARRSEPPCGADVLPALLPAIVGRHITTVDVTAYSSKTESALTIDNPSAMH